MCRNPSLSTLTFQPLNLKDKTHDYLPQSGDNGSRSQKDMVCMVCNRQFHTEQHSLLSSSSEKQAEMEIEQLRE